MLRTHGISRGGILAALLLAIVSGSAAARPLDIEQGRWRIELQGADVLHSKKTDREGDYFVSGSVEYEIPVRIHLTLSVRAYPLFIYPEPEPIYGVAAGIAFRWYPREDHKGFYAEAGVAPLWTSRYFNENSSRINFLDELGVGYRFEKDWHLSVKYQHISNAGLGSDNAGVNAISLGIGYTF